MLCKSYAAFMFPHILSMHLQVELSALEEESTEQDPV